MPVATRFIPGERQHLYFINDCRLIDIPAWRWLSDKAASLMKFLKSTGAAQPMPDDALMARLSAVTHRGKLEGALYPIPEEVLKVEGQQKVFWTPDEAAEENNT